MLNVKCMPQRSRRLRYLFIPLTTSSSKSMNLKNYFSYSIVLSFGLYLTKLKLRTNKVKITKVKGKTKTKKATNKASENSRFNFNGFIPVDFCD